MPATYIPTISSTCVLYFKHRAHKIDAPPHNFITMLGNNGHLIIIMISSKVDKILSQYTSTTSLVILEPKTLPYLPLRSVINCNSPEMYSKQELIQKIIDPLGPWDVRGCIDIDLEQKIKNAIKESILAKPKIKKALI